MAVELINDKTKAFRNNTFILILNENLAPNM